MNQSSESPQNNRPVWMDDELVKNIPQAKLDFAAQLFESGHGKSQKDMMKIVLPMMKRAKAQNLTFSQNELNACIQAIRKYSSQEELAKMDEILKKKSGQ